jgi:hypothetical protein
MGGLSYGKVLANVASIFIIGLGVIAALSQIGVAVGGHPAVLITVLATVAGILIVGVGGGLIGPMRQRWETILDKAEQEAPRAAAEVQANSLAAQSAPTQQMPPVDGTGAYTPAAAPAVTEPALSPVPRPARRAGAGTAGFSATTTRRTHLMITQDQLRNVIGTTAYDRDGDKIGKVGQVYFDDDTDQPKWITVNTGFFGTSENFVPVQGAEVAGTA